MRQCQAVVARLFVALKIFPAVVRQLVFAVPLPACDHVPHESPSGDLFLSGIIDTFPMIGQWQQPFCNRQTPAHADVAENELW